MTREKKNGVTQELLIELFEYRDGGLYWRENPSNSVDIEFEAGYSRGYYRCITLGGSSYKTHRLIYLMHNGFLSRYIDHRDGDSFNNRIENLRKCTAFQNGMNSKNKVNNESGVKGVSWEEGCSKWRARICVKGVRTTLGYFYDIIEAKMCIENFREANHGEFARHE